MPEPNQPAPSTPPAQPAQAAEAAKPAQPAPQVKSGSNKTILIIIVIIVVLAILGVGGYFLQQKLAEKTGEKAVETALEAASGGKADVDVSKGGEKVSIKTDEGSLTIGGGSVPKNWPSDITVYKGSKVTGSAETDEGLSLMLETSDSVEKVYNFYKSDLPNKGWNIITDATYGGSSMLQGEKSGKAVMLSVSKNQDNSKTLIAISVGAASP